MIRETHISDSDLDRWAYSMMFIDGRICTISIPHKNGKDFAIKQLKALFKINKYPELEILRRLHKDDKYYDFDGNELDMGFAGIVW